MDKKTKRINGIINILDGRGYRSLKELSEELGVSEMTIRRDAAELLEEGCVNLVNGVLIKNIHQEDENYDISVAGTRRGTEKEAIGRYAAALIEEGDVIALDVGTTTEQIARYLKKDMDIMIICYSYNILREIRNLGFSKIVFGGGYFREKTQTFDSEEAISLIKKYRINKAFLSAAGISHSLGVTCADSYEVPLKRAVMESSERRYLVFDSSKLDKVKAAYFGELDEFHEFITDYRITEEEREAFHSCSYKLHIV